MPHLGNRIARARVQAGYATQAVFATALGVSRGLVGQWEAHSKKPGRDNLAKIAERCAVSMEYLLGTSPSMDMSITTSDRYEVMLILASRRMSSLQKQRLAEFLDINVRARSNVEQEAQPG